MAGFTRMDKKCRCARAGECGCNFAANMTRFAHSHHDDFAVATKNGLTGSGEILVYVLIELSQPYAFNLKYLLTCLLEIHARL